MGSRRHAAEIALRALASLFRNAPRGNPLNLIRLAPAEGWFMDDEQVFSCLSSVLKPGERIVWQGRPNPWIAAEQCAFPLFATPIVMGILLYAFWNALLKSGPITPLALIITFYILGVGAFFWVRAFKTVRSCWRTAYALTDRRVIVAAGEVKSFGPAELRHISRRGEEACGSLVFLSAPPAWREMRRCGPFYDNGLFGIPEPARMQRLIHQTLHIPIRSFR